MSDLVNTVWVKGPDAQMVSFGPDDHDIPDWALEQMGDHCFVDGERDSSDGYDKRTVKKLKDEIEKRNADRDPDGGDFIVAESDKKADLVAALEIDDENQA